MHTSSTEPEVLMHIYTPKNTETVELHFKGDKMAKVCRDAPVGVCLEFLPGSLAGMAVCL